MTCSFSDGQHLGLRIDVMRMVLFGASPKRPFMVGLVFYSVLEAMFFMLKSNTCFLDPQVDLLQARSRYPSTLKVIVFNMGP